MCPMHLHRGNRVERLVDVLAQVVAEPLPDAFAAEHIAVPSPGMERYLAMELGKRLGVWANPAFPFPKALIEQAFAAVLPADAEATRGYETACLRYTIARLLGEPDPSGALREVAAYLREDATGSRKLALSARIAELFNHYSAYRPEMLRKWQRGEDDDFQAHLFRGVLRVHGPFHVGARAEAFVAALRKGRGPIKGFPTRVSLFGLSTLPPLYVHLLHALATRVDVHLFLLSPTRAYYGDLRAPRGRQSRALAEIAELADLQQEAGDATHPLLAALGRNGRELQEVLLEQAEDVDDSSDLYEDPGTASILCALQSDMLDLRERGGAAAEPRLPWPTRDESISVHACHGAMREVEVLHDQLCRALEDESLAPHDIVVMVSDIEAYAPLIEAVFSEAQGRPHIPFRIADRGALHSQRVVAALDAVLDALQGRFEANPILDLLGHRAIRDRFEISAEQVETVRAFVADSGIHWAVDAAHRAEAGQPVDETFTFRFGLSRLALGYALPDESERELCLSHAPVPVDPSDGELLGQFLSFCDHLFAFRDELRVPVPLSGWVSRIDRVLRELLIDDAETSAEHKALRRALASLAEAAERAGYEEALDIQGIRSQLMAAVDARSPAHGFLAGGVTFCQLVPMRSIPFRVVCMLGLNDGDFPSNDAPLGFDRMAQEPKIGDRSRREDDRQLFLEALLSARERVILTYVGYSLRSGELLPPSVLVTEVIEQVARTFVHDEERPTHSFLERVQLAERELLLRHPQKAWNARYFVAENSERYVSYSRASCAASRALSSERVSPRPFLTGFLPVVRPAPAKLALRELADWLSLPSRAFARHELGLRLGVDRVTLDDREPLVLNALERWKVGEPLLLAAADPHDEVSRLRALGQLPLGNPGAVEYRSIESDVIAVRATFAEATRGPRLPAHAFELEFAGVRLHGKLDELYPGGHVGLRFSKNSEKYELRHFLASVVLASLRARGELLHVPDCNLLISRAGDDRTRSVAFASPADPDAILRDWIELYSAGQGASLPLFASASRTLVEPQKEPKAGRAQLSPEAALERALDAARKAFEADGDFSQGDRSNVYVNALYRDFDEVLARPAPHDFVSLAKRVYAPLFAHRQAR